MANTAMQVGTTTPSVKRKIKVEDLYTIPREEPQSPKLTAPLSDMRDEIRSMYLYEYGRGLDEFFETTWYTAIGVQHLLGDTAMCHRFGGMLELFSATRPSDYEKFLKIPQIEARITWMLLCLPRTASTVVAQPPSGDGTSVPFDHERDKLLRRLRIFETLIINETLPQNPLAPGLSPSTVDAIDSQHEFWAELGNFVTVPSSERVGIDGSLGRLHQLLLQKENRDVLYSMAIVRSLGPWASNANANANGGVTDAAQKLAPSNNERLAVAKKFIEDEASSKGTTQVVQRLCGMAVRSWASMR